LNKTIQLLYTFYNKKSMALIMNSFDENVFINSIIYKSHINNTIDFRNYIRDFTSKNTEDINISLIIKYARTLENAINIYEGYYRYIIIIEDEDELNYADLAYVILYHSFYDDILAKILDNDLCSEEETEVESNDSY
jgi:hypothetical protein